MDDKEFDALLTAIREYNSLDVINDGEVALLTSQQISTLIDVSIELGGVSNAVIRLPLAREHLDLLLSRAYDYGRFIVFDRVEQLEPSHIDKGLNDEHSFVRLTAYNHKCCTVEQKVKYHLKWGA